MEKVNKSGMSQDQKSSAIRELLTQAAMSGGLIVLGIGVSSKLAKAGQSKNWKDVENLIGKEIKVGEKLPEGYHWHNGQIFRNKGNVDANYTALTLKDGKIALRESDRLSNPAIMNKNFEASIRADIKAKSPNLNISQIERLVRSERGRVQIHHLIPDEVVQTTELGRAAQKAGYNLDQASNLRGMPRKQSDRLDDLDIEHRGSHPKYSELVTKEMNDAAKNIRRKYKLDSLDHMDKLPTEKVQKIQREIRLEMKRIEKHFRLKIENNDPRIPIKDGKLAMIPSQMRDNGNYEIRA